MVLERMNILFDYRMMMNNVDSNPADSHHRLINIAPIVDDWVQLDDIVHQPSVSHRQHALSVHVIDIVHRV